MSKAKCVRVEIERGDGTIIRLRGEEAEKWDRYVDGLAGCCYAHGQTGPELKWETIKRTPPANEEEECSACKEEAERGCIVPSEYHTCPLR